MKPVEYKSLALIESLPHIAISKIADYLSVPDVNLPSVADGGGSSSFHDFMF